ALTPARSGGHSACRASTVMAWGMEAAKLPAGGCGVGGGTARALVLVQTASAPGTRVACFRSVWFLGRQYRLGLGWRVVVWEEFAQEASFLRGGVAPPFEGQEGSLEPRIDVRRPHELQPFDKGPLLV